MLSNKDTAAEVEKLMRQCSETLNESIRRVMETCPEDEFKAYRRAVAQVMGSIYTDIMQPIHRQYPDLEPEELRRP
jgi:hypothetical protein